MRSLTVVLQIIVMSVLMAGCIPRQTVIAPGAQGTIVDAETGQPITKAKIEQVTADEQGKFDLPANTEIGMTFPFVGGNYPVERSFIVSAPGYESRSCNCTTITPDPSCDDLVIPLQTESPVTTAPKVYVIGSDSGEKVGDNTFCSVILEQSHQGRSADAVYELGIRYINGDGIEKNIPLGRSLLTHAAEAGHQKAVDFFFTAARQGDAEAQLSCGDMLALGLGVDQDAAEAINWYKKSAAQNNTRAMLRLADIYTAGEIVSPDKNLAIKWYHKAAETGSAEAMFEFAEAYRSGDLGPIDLKQSVHWWIKAADAGSLRARDMLQQTLEADNISQETNQPILEWEKRQDK